MRGYWRVTQDGIFYLNVNAQGGPTIELHEFATGRSRRVVRVAESLGKDMFPGGLTVSPDRKWIVYSQASRSVSEIMLVENFR